MKYLNYYLNRVVKGSGGGGVIDVIMRSILYVRRSLEIYAFGVYVS